MCVRSDFGQHLDFYLPKSCFWTCVCLFKMPGSLVCPLTQPSSLLLCCRFKDTIVNAKYGGHTEAVRRLLGQLPISAQSYSGSPYLDLSLFSYDDKWVSVMERPKTCGDHPIRYANSASRFTANHLSAGDGPLSLLRHHFAVIVSICTHGLNGKGRLFL